LSEVVGLDPAQTDELAAAFLEATGWTLHLPTGDRAERSNINSDSMCSAPVDPGVGASPGRIRVGFNSNEAARSPDSDVARCSADAAKRLAASISRIVERLSVTQRIVRDRDAELAAGAPVIATAEDSEQFAGLLESVLQAGADACDCQAAALYMLDDATTSLALRASVGLAADRLLQPPRPLKGAVADLEALLGHAVALERASAFGPWRVPEDFAAALCVPVSSSTTPLGTVWFFSDRPRDFTDQQTNLAEVVAGRLAAELERATLLATISLQPMAAGASEVQRTAP
jgi:sigma-B regulation protein RsbU (phosphoserine phosphatase)